MTFRHSLDDLQPLAICTPSLEAHHLLIVVPQVKKYSRRALLNSCELLEALWISGPRYLLPTDFHHYGRRNYWGFKVKIWSIWLSRIEFVLDFYLLLSCFIVCLCLGQCKGFEGYGPRIDVWLKAPCDFFSGSRDQPATQTQSQVVTQCTDEQEEFEAIEKLQQLGINQGANWLCLLLQ